MENTPIMTAERQANHLVDRLQPCLQYQENLRKRFAPKGKGQTQQAEFLPGAKKKKHGPAFSAA